MSRRDLRSPVAALVAAIAAFSCGSSDQGDPLPGGAAAGPSDANGDGSGVGATSPGGVPGTPLGSCGAAPSDFDPLSQFTPPVRKATRAVTSANDVGPGSLREALAAAVNGDVIGFDARLAGSIVRLESQLVVRANVVIDASAAKGLALDGGGKTRLFYVDKGRDATFVGLTLENGKTAMGRPQEGEGAAIDVDQDGAKLTVLGCIFQGNVADRGGAIRIGYGSTADIEDSVFSNNDGSGAKDGFSAGAIATFGTGKLVVKRSRFVGNRGWTAGAIYNLSEPVIIEDSVFLQNSALGGGGGGLGTDGGERVGAPNCTPGNDCEQGEITVRRSWFEDNEGLSGGGAMHLWGYLKDDITVEDCVVKGNKSKGNRQEAKGAGIRLHGIAPVAVRNTSFIENVADTQGGALWVDGTGPFTFVNITASGNKVLDDTGGFLTYNGSGPLTLASSTIVRNSSGRACGAIWGDTSRITIRNSIIAFNTAGQDHGQDQVSDPMTDGGGNLVFATSGDAKSATQSPKLRVDPQLGPLAAMDGALLVPLLDGSPAIDAATTPTDAPTDGRDAPRGAIPDIGAFEVGAICAPTTR